MGNPHAVLKVNDVQLAQVSEIGEALESHPFFPEPAVSIKNAITKIRIRMLRSQFDQE
jgi:diaminopimelate epimerase